ncbi:MAG TPA: 4Fe-4S binding protein [Anaerolineae bacterium]|nr:4Fe-4S binding protein [Anaerolineae bacterium]
MDSYVQLRAKLAAHPAGAPDSQEILEILRILFSPEEAAVALHLPFRPMRDIDIAERAGLTADEVVARCESMADKGLVYAYEARGRHFYMLFPTAPGLFEFPMMKHGQLDLPYDRLSELWDSYYRSGWGAEMIGDATHMARVIPIDEAIQAQQTVLSFDEVSGYLERAKYISVQDCACRVANHRCEAPVDVCLALDYGAKYLSERGMGRLITREEAQAVLRRAHDAGLVQMTSNTRDKVEFICNCCSCCCGLLGTVTRLGGAAHSIASNFLCRVAASECIACGLCEAACPVGAISVDDVASICDEQCIGCGVCVPQCPQGALALVRRESTSVPPVDQQALLLEVAAEKGRLDRFAKELGSQE